MPIMKRMLLAAAVTASLAACATVQHGPAQRIRVDSDPPEAVVRTEKCGPGSTKSVRTPAVIWVSRRAERCTLTFSAPGYAPSTVMLRRGVADEFLQNTEIMAGLCGEGALDCDEAREWFAFFLLGGFLAGTGFGVDSITGAMFELQPNDVFVELVSVDER